MKKLRERIKNIFLKMLYLSGVMSMGLRAKVLAGLVVMLVLLYLFFFSGLLASENIPIISQLRIDRPPVVPAAGRNARRAARVDPLAKSGVQAVIFALDKPRALTSVQVYLATDLEWAKGSAKPIWSLVAAKPDQPVKVDGFRYGGFVRGMKPADPAHPRPEPLLPETTYRLIIQAGRAQGQLDFQTQALPQETPPAP